MQIVKSNSQILSTQYNQVQTRFDKSHEVLWTFINQQNMVPCFNAGLLDDLFNHHEELTKTDGFINIDNETHKIRYSVLASKTPGYFNMGGHLIKMAEAIRNKDRDTLTKYAIKSIDVVAQRTFRHNLPTLNTISLLQGETLGAGIEAAMTSDIVIAERQSILAFPEIHFNMFPAMGAYSFISRKAGVKVADKMILSGKSFTAEECYDMGIIDILAEEGEGHQAVYDYIDKQKRRAEGFLSIQKTKGFINPITYQELFNIVNLWVENALSLSERDLKMMDRFIRSQEKLFASETGGLVAAEIPMSEVRTVGL